MSIEEALEGLMLGCFAIGWYWSIFKMLSTGKPYGKSGIFVLCTVTGYALGLGAQLMAWAETGVFGSLIFFYGWNVLVTCIDLILFLYLSGREESRVRVPIPANLPIAPAHYGRRHRRPASRQRVSFGTRPVQRWQF